jgi:hypothetical protein
MIQKTQHGMRIRVEILTTTEAFAEKEGREVSRILSDLARKTGEGEISAEKAVIFDSNRTICGIYECEPA